MEKILLTGFEAFGNTPINPAELVAKALNNTQIDNAYIVSHIVPNTFFKSIDYVIKLINEIQPKLVIMMGEYAGRTMITIERIAHNLNDATRYQLTDNAGKAPQDQLTIPDGPTAYYSTLPISAMT
ncbi:hypothetical protein fh0823_06990 [Francisella halioticida]|nr:hypothetical protein fh0823_06990 [Francisella halioticida]